MCLGSRFANSIFNIFSIGPAPCPEITLLSQGRILSSKFGRRVIFDLEDIDMILNSLKRDTEHYEKLLRR